MDAHLLLERAAGDGVARPKGAVEIGNELEPGLTKALEGARKALALHEQYSQQESASEAEHHQTMIAHYRLLLKRWESSDD